MLCPNCRHDNPADNKFCAECGSELVIACPACQTVNPPTSKFCGECGTALLAAATSAAAPARAEQRLVSVLFADLVGFTPFSESRDSEEVRDMLTTYFDRAREIVARFGGTVDKFIGDAVMAVWGAVEAREDDAERSVRAALELVDMVAVLGDEIGVPDLALRAGVMSGETSVGPGGNEKGLVVGDLVNTASRLQSIAAPRTVLVGEPTRNLTAASIQFEALGEQIVKGKESSVAAFHALRVIGERGGGRRAEGMEPPFTGRDVELRLLKDQFHATGRDGGARLVSVIGEAGIGKSRLSWELEKYLDGLADVVYWHRGRSPSYGEGLTMWALGEMVRSRAGIVEVDDPAKARIKLRTAVAEYVGSEDDRRWLEPRLAALLGLDSAPTGDREELYAAFRTFFHHIADRGTAVLVFEDMHWADEGLLEFVAGLVERSPRHPIFVVTLSRPDLLDAHPGWDAGRRNFVSLHLAPLGDDDMADLVRGTVPGIPEATAQSIVARAGGIPLYAVEFVRMLLADGELEESGDGYRIVGALDELALPESLQAVIGARLDRMPLEDRQLVQDAAVLGHSFTLEGLAIIRDTDPDSLAVALRDLVRGQILEVDDDPRSPERGQYRFVQSVIREVAYGRLSKSDRYARHLKVAQYFEELAESELVGAVASHYLSAHEAAPQGEGADLLERGRNALSDAAGRAADLQSHGAALSLLTQALALCETPAERAPLLERAALAAAWGSVVDRSIELAAEAAGLYEEIGDEPGRLRALTLQAFTMSSNFRADESVELLQPAYDALHDPSTAEEVALALETARAYMLNQQHELAVEVTERVLSKAEAILSPADVIDGIITRATALGSLHRPMEALALLMGAEGLADQHELQAQAIRAFNNLSVIRSLDAPGLPIDEMEAFLARVRRFGAPAWLNRTLLMAAGYLLAHGKREQAEQALDEVESFELNELEQSQARYLRAHMAALSEGTPEQLAELWEAASHWENSEDMQMRGLTENLKSTAKTLEGDYRAAATHSLGDSSGDGVLAAVLNAIATADTELMERARAHAESVAGGGRVGRACGLLIDAALAALGGDLEAAAGGFSESIDLLDRIAPPITGVVARALFSGLVGTDHPSARRAGEEARAWLRQAGFRRFEQLWEHLLPSDSAVASESA